MPPSCLHTAAGSSATALLQQCLAAVELPEASAIAVPQLTSTFDCCAEAQPLAAAAHAGDAAAEQAALKTWVCSEPADVWRRCTAAHMAVQEAPCFMLLAIATAAPRMHDIRAAMSAADAEVAQLLGNISLQVCLYVVLCQPHQHQALQMSCIHRRRTCRNVSFFCSQCHGWRTAGSPLMTTSFSAISCSRSDHACCLWSVWMTTLQMRHQIR